ncbi:hypothetical protein MPSEU_000408300 [Mayamaea pseudoterrestris]|nr:hypothetical protein MPSEU_000408300 [Mayamaea pseudoterrestris]
MCVTNTTTRRLQAVSFPVEQVGGCSPSDLSQGLMGSFSLDGSVALPRLEPDVSETIYTQQDSNKSRAKRQRKPQKPGKTAKMNDRHFVEHNYHDHAGDVDENDASSLTEFSEEHRRRGGVAVTFPERLHQVLEQVERDGYAHIISWQPHGRCFLIHKPKEFAEHVMPKYFRVSKLTSFQRQLNLWGWSRLTRGPDASAYYHELFLRGREFLSKRMLRVKVKGTKFKAASSPENEPDFYRMPPVTYVTPNHSSDEEMSQDSSMRGANGSFAFNVGAVNRQHQVNMQALSYSSPLQQPHVTLSSYFAPVSSDLFTLNHYEQPTPPPQFQADSILDQAVDELFMGELESEDTLKDFVDEWDPTFGAVLNDDIQLGFMLEKLLED